jgi:hypothetical protein
VSPSDPRAPNWPAVSGVIGDGPNSSALPHRHPFPSRELPSHSSQSAEDNMPGGRPLAASATPAPAQSLEGDATEWPPLKLPQGIQEGVLKSCY